MNFFFFLVKGQTVNNLGILGLSVFFHSYLTLLWQCESSYRQYINKLSSVPVKVCFQKQWVGHIDSQAIAYSSLHYVIPA